MWGSLPHVMPFYKHFKLIKIGMKTARHVLIFNLICLLNPFSKCTCSKQICNKDVNLHTHVPKHKISNYILSVQHCHTGALYFKAPDCGLWSTLFSQIERVICAYTTQHVAHEKRLYITHWCPVLITVVCKHYLDAHNTCTTLLWLCCWFYFTASLYHSSQGSIASERM